MLRKFQPGDRQIPAATLNAMLDCTIAFQEGRGQTRGFDRPQQDKTGSVIVLNKTGEDLDEFSLVEIDKPTILPDEDENAFRRGVVLEVRKATDAQLPWVITQHPIPKDRPGSAVISGVTICWINLQDTADDRVDSGDGLTIPQSGTSGPATIVWVKGGVTTAEAYGEQWAVLQLGGGGGGGDGSIFRCIITTGAGAGTGGPIVGVKLVDDSGVATGAEFHCVPTGHVAVGEYLYAYEPESGTGVTSILGDVLFQETGTRGQSFAVSLVQTGGGSAGSQSTKCTFKYTVKDEAGSITLGTGLNPENQTDYSNGKRQAASKGTAWIHTDGSLKFFCFEDRTAGTC